MMPNTITLGSLEEFRRALRDFERVVVIFHGEYEGNSQQMMPLFRKYSDDPKMAKLYKFIEVDCYIQPDISSYCGIRAIPHMIVYRGMLKVDEVIGSQIYNKALWTEELIVTDKKIRSQFLEDRTNNLDPYAPI